EVPGWCHDGEPHGMWGGARHLRQMQALFTVVAGKVDTFRDFWIRLIDGFTGFGTHDFDQITACRGKMISDADQYLAAGCQRLILPRCAGLYARGYNRF